MAKNKKEEKYKEKGKSVIFLWVLFSVGLVWIIPEIALFLTSKYSFDYNKVSSFANFIYGTTSPWLTFTSFIALVLTLETQKKQLNVQNRQLLNSFDEMKKTREDVEKQNRTISIQRFENTFFQMVNLHNNIVDSMIYPYGQNPEKKTGRNAFVYFYLNNFKVEYNRVKNNDEFRNKDELVKVRTAYVKFFSYDENYLGHYFRNLYRIVKFINDSDIITFEEKKMYIGIIKAQLSSNEQALLLYNGLNFVGSNFLPLMYRYNMLDNLNENILLDPYHLELFKQEATSTSY